MQPAFVVIGRLSLGELIGKDAVHAAIGAPDHRLGRHVFFDQLGELIFVVALLLQRRPGDLLRHLISRAAAGGIEGERPGRTFWRLRVEHVVAVADIDLGFEVRHLEMVVALLEHHPERHVRIVAVLGKVRRRQPERIGLDLKFLLSAEKRVPRQRVDFADLLVGHGVAAARRAVAVDHQERAAIAVRLVVSVGKTDVDGEIIIGIGVHQSGRDRVEAFGRLTVAFGFLRPEFARPATDRIDLQQLILAGGVLFPDFKLRFLFEDANEDRRVLRHILLLQQRQHFRRQLLHRPGRQLIALFAVAAGKRQRSRAEHGRRHDQAQAHGARRKHAGNAGADQGKVPRQIGHPLAITC